MQCPKVSLLSIDKGRRIEGESGKTKGRYPVQHVSYIPVPAAAKLMMV